MVPGGRFPSRWGFGLGTRRLALLRGECEVTRTLLPQPSAPTFRTASASPRLQFEERPARSRLAPPAAGVDACDATTTVVRGATPATARGTCVPPR